MRKNLMKGILAAALALCLVVTGLFGNGWAVEAEDDTSSAETTESTDTSDESSGVIIAKDATPLTDELQTTVTLTVGGTQGVENVAVIFVLDYSTSVDVRNAAGAFLKELASKENTNVKAAVVDYSSVAAATEWTTITSDTNISGDEGSGGLLASKTSSGTNYHAGLLKAQEMLKSSEIEGYTKYLITISDGITYLWTDESTDKTMSVYIEGEAGDGVITKWNSNDAWKMRYGYGTALSDERLDALTSGSIASTDAYTNTINIQYEWKSGADIGENFIPQGKYENYLIGSEVAIYKTASVYSELLESVDYAYAFKMDENNWGDFPYGEQLMDYLISVSNNSGSTASGEISDDTAASVFSTIKNQILYEINSGKVTDVIGSDFNLVDLDTFALKVGGVVQNKAVDDTNNTVNFGTQNDDGTYPYSVVYDPDAETFVWYINVPVEAEKGLELSYDLVLDKNVITSTPGTQTTDTNESAVIEYDPTDPEEPDGEEEFNKPTVDYVNIGAEKKWVDNNDENGLRPDSITLFLSRNGSAYETVTIYDDGDGDNTWSYVFKGLPAVDENGDAYTYVVTEDKESIENYTSGDPVEADNVFTITNKVTEKIDITVSKVWDDSNDKDGIRPSSVEGCLVENGTATDLYKFTLSEENNWTYTFSNFEKYDEEGVEIEWSAYEYETYSGYTEYTVSYSTTINEDGSIAIVISNAHVPTDTTTEDPTDPTDDTEETTTTTETTEETTVETVSDPVVTTSAETGDNSNLELFVGLLAVCVVAMIALVTVESRKRTK